MNRTCAACGKPFVAKRSTAKYCGSSCRAKVSTGAVVLLNPDAPTPDATERGPQEESTLRVLLHADRADHPLGVAALALSRDIDSRETPVNMRTAAIKQLSVTLSEALKGATTGSAVDELRRRRDQQRTG